MPDGGKTRERRGAPYPPAPGEIDRLRGRAWFAHSGDAIVDLDLAGVIAGFNPAAERLFGYAATEVLGHPAGVLLPGRDPAKAAAMLADRAARRDVEPYVIDYRRPDGKVAQLWVTAVPLADRDDRPVGLTFIVTDLTPLRRAATELAARDSLYQTMVETAHEGIAIFDPGLHVCFANARLGDMVGASIDELIGRSARAFLFPADVTKILTMAARRRRGISEGFELRLKHRNGNAVWVWAESSPIDDRTGHTQSLVMFSDVTAGKAAELALRESEALFRSHFEHAAVGIARVALNGTLLEVNPALSRIMGYQAEELAGRSFDDIAYPDGRQANAETIRRVSAGLDSWAEIDERYIHRDGHVVHVHVSLSLAPGTDAAPGHLAVVVQDVTESVAALDALRRSEETLRLLADNAQDLIFRYRFGGNPGFDYASPALESLYGYRLEDFPPRLRLYAPTSRRHPGRGSSRGAGQRTRRCRPLEHRDHPQRRSEDLERSPRHRRHRRRR
ncbi:MAG: PAS domain S-box protein [Mycobacteriales bacterium]